MKRQIAAEPDGMSCEAGVLHPEAPKPETDFETMARDFAHWWFGSDWENDRFTLELAMRFKDFRAAHSLDGHVEKILAMSHDEIRALSIIEGSHADIDAATAETAMHRAVASAAKTRLAEVERERDEAKREAFFNGENAKECAQVGADWAKKWREDLILREAAETALATVQGQLARSDDAVAVLYESAPDDNPATAITEAIARHKARAAGKGTES